MIKRHAIGAKKPGAESSALAVFLAPRSVDENDSAGIHPPPGYDFRLDEMSGHSHSFIPTAPRGHCRRDYRT